MGNNRFYIGDTHFGHANILGFKRDDGTPLRQFTSVYEMDGYMVSKWNEVVKDTDTVYHLGDICIHSKNLDILRGLKGRKILIMGNHDRDKVTKYIQYFADVRAYDRKDGIICSHIPIHPGSLGKFGVNVHGHLHYQEVKMKSQYSSEMVIDPRYFNVSVECIDYTPVEYSVLMGRIEQRQKQYER